MATKKNVVLPDGNLYQDTVKSTRKNIVMPDGSVFKDTNVASTFKPIIISY
jgi:hypothetical protein